MCVQARPTRPCCSSPRERSARRVVAVEQVCSGAAEGQHLARPILLITRRGEGRGVTSSFSRRAGNTGAELSFFAEELGLAPAYFPSGQNRWFPLLQRRGRPRPGHWQGGRGGIVPETERVFQNLSAVLKAAGKSFDDVMRAGVFLKNMSDFVAMNGIYAKYFSQPFPARTTVGTAALPLGACVEIDLVVKA
jgi:reactive intermediate/imine deaminase